LASCAADWHRSQAIRHAAAGLHRINCRPQALIAAFTVE
jgi:hypothetical protein